MMHETRRAVILPFGLLKICSTRAISLVHSMRERIKFIQACLLGTLGFIQTLCLLLSIVLDWSLNCDFVWENGSICGELSADQAAVVKDRWITPQKPNIDTQNCQVFKGNDLFQSIMGIHVSFQGCSCHNKAIDGSWAIYVSGDIAYWVYYLFFREKVQEAYNPQTKM